MTTKPNWDDDGYILAVRLHEKGNEMFPHLPDISFPAPPGYQPRESGEAAGLRAGADGDRHRPVRLGAEMVLGRDSAECGDDYWPEDHLPYEPEGRVIERPSRLTNEVGKIYDAASFLNWHYGLWFTTHIVLNFRLMGIEDHRVAAALMAVFNKEMKRWREVGPVNTTGRWKKRARSPLDWPYLWLYVFERSRYQGFHAHQLCVCPRDQAKAFAAHARIWWSRAAMLEVPADAIRMQQSRAADRYEGHRRQVEWLRYLLKTADRDLGAKAADGRWWPVAEIFKLDPYWETQPVYSPQLYGICHALSASRQREEGFRSKLQSGEFGELYSGWELRDHFARQLSWGDD